MQELEGGRTGLIWRDGNTVVRPSGPWTPTVHRFLRYLRDKGFSGAPFPVELTQNQEIVSYVEGRVCEHLSDEMVGSQHLLRSAAGLLRQFHIASHGFLEADREAKIWMLEARKPCEIVCHGDFAPYNIATANEVAVGIIDFDTAHPAPALWDLAYAVYRWSPLSAPSNEGVVFGIDEQFVRAKIFCDAYGATPEDKRRLPDMICLRLQALVDFMTSRAEAGDAAFAEDIAADEQAVYLRDIGHIRNYQDQLLLALR